VAFTAEGSAWITDGTAAGTRVLSVAQNLDPAFAQVGAQLLGALDDGVHGVEVWRLDAAARAEVVGHGCGTPGRAPRLRANDPVLGGHVAFNGDDVQSGAVVVVALGLPMAPPVPIPGTICALYFDPTALVGLLPAQVTGTRFVAFLPLPRMPALAGTGVMAQALALPGATALGLDASNGVRLNLGLR
jgi:hypothetical protein